MDQTSEDAELSRNVARTRPVRMPSPVAQGALFVVGTIALFLLVMQLTAPGSNGLVNGRGTSFGGHGPAIHHSLPR